MVLAALSIDPALRGLLIVFAAVVILPGSVFLLLSTNLGARVGFLLALTGFFGWMSVQGLIWTVYAQGNRGADPHWVTQELVTGDAAQSTVEAMDGFPRGWNRLQEGDKILGDAQAAADAVLSRQAQQAATTGGHTGAGTESHFEAPFAAPTDYVMVAAYNRGGEHWPPIEHVPTIKHKPHYAVVQVQPVVTSTTVPGAAPPRPVADPSKPVTTVVMVRDLGNVRFPPFMLGVSSFAIFAVLVSILHRRDKEAMAARAALQAA